MNIIVTGSLGHISRPLATTLIQKGHTVTVISSKAEKKAEIEALGAKAAIGQLEDAGFLTSTFTGADAVYCLFPAGGFFDPNFNIMAAITGVARNYKTAIQQAGIKKVVHLSSIGAHTGKDNGLLAFHYQAEQILGELPEDVSIKYLRPVGFYYNLLGFINGIKTHGVIASNYGGDQAKPWVSTKDIAAVAAEEITGAFKGRTVRYIASEEISCADIAHLLGAAIGKPDLAWITIPSQQLLDIMLGIGMNREVAAGLVEMNEHINDGSLFVDYYQHRPTEFGPTKVKDFASEFAAAYNQ